MSISTVGLKISRAWMDSLLWNHGRRHDELQPVSRASKHYSAPPSVLQKIVLRESCTYKKHCFFYENFHACPYLSLSRLAVLSDKLSHICLYSSSGGQTLETFAICSKDNQSFSNQCSGLVTNSPASNINTMGDQILNLRFF